MALITSHYVGADVAQDTIAFCGSTTATIKNTPAALRAYLGTLPVGVPLVCEATGRHHYALHQACAALGRPLTVLNPAHARAYARSLGKLEKTDTLDAAILRRFGQERRPAATPLPTPALQTLRDLLMVRTALAETAIRRVLSEKKVNNFELTARSRDGKETVVSYNAMTFYDRDRRLQGVFAAARDVTERKRLDQALQETNSELVRAKSAAEKANLAKSDFLSSMSHELRSPLNAILGFAQLMESDAPPPVPAQAARIGQILQAGWHLLNLINEILDLAVVESGKVSLSREPVALAEVMDECQTMMEPQAQQRSISMIFPEFAQPVYVWADRTRLKQITINLLSNAIKYNREQGNVTVECQETPAGRIRIKVQDTGMGLSPEKLAQLFQPFNRLGQEAHGVVGTGIGLVVTKQLVELMDGTMGVESTVGQGSVFWVELGSSAAPALIEVTAEPAVNVQVRRSATPRMRTLLYIEDNPANMELVEQLIARRPELRLLKAVTGTLGIELARSALPDVILMDINLPGLSGTAALKILREDPATAHIPVVALSANAMPRDIESGLEAGFFYYLTKPIKVKEFMDTLDVALELAGMRSAKISGAGQPL